MEKRLHSFHIPVMGIGHSVDTPIRVAPFGITSVISLVDDVLIEKIRKHYSEQYGLPYVELGKSENDGRAKRITAYLETVQSIVQTKLEAIKKEPFFEANDKRRYFEMLPEDAALKIDYNRLLEMRPGAQRATIAEDLTRRMRSGSIDVNIMVKLDAPHTDEQGVSLGDDFSDARSALRGYARSSLRSGVVFSAGMNPKLFTSLSQFPDFYRDDRGEIKKRIILKVSDFRSALIQGKYLAKLGLEVYEFRIESGLNCGGHAFPSNGELLPCILQEFKDKREQLGLAFKPSIMKYYQRMGWTYPSSIDNNQFLTTVQGGIGNHGEATRLLKDFGMNLTGWASPFLLVPEATCVDEPSRRLLEQAGPKDLFVSDVSPLQIPFNNIHNTGSEKWTFGMAAAGNPGSACPKRFLKRNTEFTQKPICIASKQYQKRKLAQIDALDIPENEKEQRRRKVVEKSCICEHLGNGALIALGIADPQNAPQLICPGPNIAWFNRTYSLKEMVDHIYGRGVSLVPPERPHMFAAEIEMYVDFFEKSVSSCSCSEKEFKVLDEFKTNLDAGIDFCLSVAQKPPYPGENLASIVTCVTKQKTRLTDIFSHLKKKGQAALRQSAPVNPYEKVA